MYAIDVDFDVYKQLTLRRETESVTYNDVIRELLGLDRNKERPARQSADAVGDWVTKGVRFPAGTEFRAAYKGQQVSGRVDGGALFVNGKRFDSPSAAAVSITGGPVNGWRFWECRLPGKSSWRLIETLREPSA